MSALDQILNFKRDEEDFYAILGCDENSTVEQIMAEYKVRALQYHPDKNDGDKEAEVKFQKMKEAKETLCDPEKRANYDKWRNSGISVSYKQWLGMKEHVHQSMHWAMHKTKDRMLPEGSSSAAQRAASSGPPGAHRRASEGGANIHWGGRGNVQWDSSASSEHAIKPIAFDPYTENGEVPAERVMADQKRFALRPERVIAHSRAEFDIILSEGLVI